MLRFSSLAKWYSAFSDRSPSAAALRIRSCTSICDLKSSSRLRWSSAISSADTICMMLTPVGQALVSVAQLGAETACPETRTTAAERGGLAAKQAYHIPRLAFGNLRFTRQTLADSL